MNRTFSRIGNDASFLYLAARLLYFTARLLYFTARLHYLAARLLYLIAWLLYGTARLLYRMARLRYGMARLRYRMAWLLYPVAPFHGNLRRFLFQSDLRNERDSACLVAVAKQAVGGRIDVRESATLGGKPPKSNGSRSFS
ncbi:MAG: hypothetical protein KDA59_17855 [Planctomycetales bacterium]|nr:hypothetical protein [Planctomycetales bacterium]